MNRHIFFKPPMVNEKPFCEPWSLVPMLCLLGGALSFIAIYFLIRFLNKKNNTKALNIIIFIYGLLFLIMEVMHEISRYQDLGHYDFSSFPFQFCSIPIYFCLFIPFLKEGKFKTYFYYYLAIFGFGSGIIPLILGQGQLCRWSTAEEVIRSFVWHILILQLAFISTFHIKVAYNIKETYKFLLGSMVIFFSLTVIAQILNVILHYTGGINFKPKHGMDYKDSMSTSLNDPDSASLFYISPFFASNMPVFHDIWIKCGWVVNYIAYLFGFSILANIIYFANYGLRRLAFVLFTKNKNLEPAE